jgi:cytoskeletal protein RodZ
MTTPKRTTTASTPPWEQGPDSEGLTFGTWLRQQREVRDVGLREVAEASKISFRYLEAFEQDRFDLLPPAVFSRGFLRQYALYVGLDPDEVLNYFLWAQQEGEGNEEEDRPSELSVAAEPNLTAWMIGGGIVLLLAAIAFLAWGLAGRERPAEDSGEVFVPPVVAPLPAPAEPSPPEEISGAPLQVSLEFVRNCWVEAVVDGGAQRIAQEFAQGESLQIDAERVVVFQKLGNAGGVQMEVNGEVYPLAGAEGSLLKDLVIDLEVAAALVDEAAGEAAP